MIVASGLQPIDSAAGLDRPLGKCFFFPLAEGLPDLPSFQSVIELYDKKRGNELMPCRASYRFADLRGWHASFGLTLFDEDLKDGNLKILGERYIAMFGGVLWQGMRVSEASHPNLPGLTDYFRSLLTTPSVGYFVGTLPNQGRRHVRAEILDLPALDENGNVRYLLSFIRNMV